MRPQGKRLIRWTRLRRGIWESLAHGDNIGRHQWMRSSVETLRKRKSPVRRSVCRCSQGGAAPRGSQRDPGSASGIVKPQGAKHLKLSFDQVPRSQRRWHKIICLLGVTAGLSKKAERWRDSMVSESRHFHENGLGEEALWVMKGCLHLASSMSRHWSRNP